MEILIVIDRQDGNFLVLAGRHFAKGNRENLLAMGVYDGDASVADGIAAVPNGRVALSTDLDIPLDERKVLPWLITAARSTDPCGVALKAISKVVNKSRRHQISGGLSWVW